ncbi:MAG: ribosome silencing factor [Clostridia bacterium]|nr:ribosome silencing factor [Clostridia bacterium]
MNSLQIKDIIIELLKAKKATDITVIDVAEQTIIADFFIIATGKSTSQVKALTESLEEKGEEKGLTLLRRDGEREARWVVMDYGGVIVHIFNDSTRDFYALEKLWEKGNNVTKIED